MTHASLFSGIGGPEVAAQMMGWENLYHCEIRPKCRQVLKYWFPKSKSYDDIKTTDFREWRGKVDVLTGGFPCQPFSTAGRRGGAEDDRYLWPEMLRAIRECKPTWVVCENVDGLLTMVESPCDVELASETSLFDEENIVRRYQRTESFTIERICKDLEDCGYSVWPFDIPAAGVGAPHKRNRVFIIANVKDSVFVGQPRTEIVADESRSGNPRSASCPRDTADTKHNGLEHSSHKADDSQETETERVGRKDGATIVSKSVEADGLRRIAADTNGGAFDNGQSGVGTGSEPQVYEFGECIRQGGADLSGLYPDQRWRTFPTVSPIYRGNDGFPFYVDDLTIPFSTWRKFSLESYGNAIVPQVMYEIFRAIESTYERI